jgi:hypothetical protein
MNADARRLKVENRKSKVEIVIATKRHKRHKRTLEMRKAEFGMRNEPVAGCKLLQHKGFHAIRGCANGFDLRYARWLRGGAAATCGRRRWRRKMGSTCKNAFSLASDTFSAPARPGPFTCEHAGRCGSGVSAGAGG